MNGEHEEATADEQNQLAVVETEELSPEQKLQCLLRLRDDPRVGKIAASPLFPDILKRYAGGETDKAMEEWSEQEGHPVSEVSFQRFRQKYITPLIGPRKKIVQLKELVEARDVKGDELQRLEGLANFQEKRLVGMGLTESDVDTLKDIGRYPKKFKHDSSVRGEVVAMKELLKDIRQIRREEGVLSELVERAQSDDVVLEETTHRKLSRASAVQIWRLARGLDIAIEDRSPPDVTITERDSDEGCDDDNRGHEN